MGFDKSKFYFVKNAVTIHENLPDDFARTQKQKDEIFELLFVARFVPKKCLIETIEACKIIKDRGYKFVLYCIGDGETRNEAENLVEKYALENEVIFTGYIPEQEVTAHFFGRDILLFPTKYGEGFPNVFFKAVAVGMPIVSTKFRAARDFLEEEKNYLACTSEPESIAEKIIELIENKSLREQMSKNNFEFGKSLLPENIAKEFLEIYAIYLTKNQKPKTKNQNRMCGIAGIISPNPEASIGAMLASIEHRGRDDEGVFVSDAFGENHLKTCFGHRRLSILDPTPAGHQPFFSDDKRFVLTYNGEIYNFEEIREELKKKNHKFKTDCDTEVLIKAFEEWRFDCLEKLNGMFAFAVWDEREKTLFAARDRTGLKPLYYAKIDKNFVFASEIKAILASKLIRAELDREGLNQFLTFLWTVPPHTLFKDIYQLPPAHFLIWKNGEIETREWWDLDFSVEEKSADEQLWSERVLETLEKVVRMEMISDVPLGRVSFRRR